jgi:hypothetical protein
MTTQKTETQWTWWTPPVNRPAYILHTKDGETEEGMSIPDNLVICDICNATISLRPVPLLYISYATCPVCFQRDTGISAEEAAILDGIKLAEIEVAGEVQL